MKVKQIHIFYANYYEASVLFFRTVSEQMRIYLHAFLLPLHAYSVSHTLRLSTQEYRADLVCNILFIYFILNKCNEL